MIEGAEGHYEVQKTSYGEAYVWCPEGGVRLRAETGPQRLRNGLRLRGRPCGPGSEGAGFREDTTPVGRRV